MTDQPQQTNPNDHRYYPEDEIDLMDYLLVIWKWKYFIFIGTAFCLLIAVIISRYSINQQVDMILKPAIKNIDINGNEVYIDSPQVIKMLVEGELKYEVFEMIEKAGEKQMSKSFDAKVDIPNGQNLLFVSLKTKNADIDIRKLNFLIQAVQTKTMGKINIINRENEKNISLKKDSLLDLKVQEDRILKKYNKDLVVKRAALLDLKVQEDRILKKYNEDMRNRKNKLNNLENKEKVITKDIENINERLEATTSENDIIRKNTEKLINERKSLINKEAENEEIASFLLSNLFQQNMSLSQSYQNQLVNYIFTRNQKEDNLFTIRNQLEDIKREMMEQESAMKNSQTISILFPALYEIRKQIENVSKDIKELESVMSSEQSISILLPDLYGIRSRIEKVEIEIKELSKEKENIQPIKIVQPPTISKFSKFKRNVILSSVMGLFFMLFLSFFIEYVRNYKNRIKK